MAITFCQDIYQMLCRKYPNRNIYIIGDHHFYHKNILNFTRQNFNDVLEMNDYILKCHNEIVGKDDIVIFLGDFCFKNAEIKEMVDRMNGHKYLILGNHDPENLIQRYPSLGFEGVFKNPVKMDQIYLSHEPLMEGEKEEIQFQFVLKEFQKCASAKNYHGHIHKDNEEVSPNHKNSTCEALGYKPIIIGRTEELNNKGEHQLFINSSYFEKILESLRERRSIDCSVAVSDYLYSFILDKSAPYENDFFIQGSFGLFKKYNFLSKFSDLDVSFIFDGHRSKKESFNNFKRMIDASYEALKEIDGINLSFYKRYSSLRIYEALYTTKKGAFSKNYLDANLIAFNNYRASDFQRIEGKSIVECFVSKYFPSLLAEYEFPRFQSQSLIPEGDVTNLILQLLFESGREEKKNLIFRKLQYVYGCSFKEKKMSNFSDIFIRFFLRNICLLHTMNRYGEIEYIQNNKQYMVDILSYLPVNMQNEFSELLNDFLYEFLEIHKEVSSVPAKETYEKCLKIMNQIK